MERRRCFHRRPLPPAENFKPRPHGEEAAKAGLKADVLARLDVEMQRHVAAKNVAGIAALIHRNGVRGYFETFGMADIEAGQADAEGRHFPSDEHDEAGHRARRADASRRGQVHARRADRETLPEWAEPKVKEDGELVPAKSAITPRMLMSHSSGLDYGGGRGRGGDGVSGDERNPARRLKDFSEAVAKEPLMFQPGTGYNYGMGLDILGRYLEALAGKPLDECSRSGCSAR